MLCVQAGAAEFCRSCHNELLQAVAAVRKGEQSGVVQLKPVDEQRGAVGFAVRKRGDQLLMLSLDASWMLKPGTVREV